MKIAPQVVSAPLPPTVKTNTHNELNPAKQAKAAEPSAKGAAFGALVSEFAHTRNAARHAAKHGVQAPPVTPPAVETPPATETAPATTPTVTEPGTGEAINLTV